MQARSRSGFTLIELMVAMALTLLIMVILTQAFSIALETFATAKGIGDLTHNLRVATVNLRDDVMQDHFEGKRRLSDVTLTGGSQLVAEKPQAGFFAILQGSPSLLEGYDQNYLPSYRAVDHVLYMTVKRRGNRAENFFYTSLTAATPADPRALDAFFLAQQGNSGMSASTPPYSIGIGSTAGYFSSQWAEVMYYLVRTGSTEQPNNPTATVGTPTFALMRAEFVMVPSERNVPTGIPIASSPMFPTIACNPGAVDVEIFSPADSAAAASQRVVPTQFAAAPAVSPMLSIQPDGTPNLLFPYARVAPASTLVLPNLISFQIQIMPTGTAVPAFVDVPGGVYDTALINAPGYRNNFGLRAIQITLRVWDPKTRQTRQITVVQDM